MSCIRIGAQGFRRGFSVREPSAFVMVCPATAAKQAGLSKQTITTLCRNGEFPGAKKIGSNGWRIPEISLAQFISSDKTFISTAPKTSKTKLDLIRSLPKDVLPDAKTRP